MKGYDACVFPREGEPVLLCLEASAEDAARTAWTDDVRFVRGYDETTRGRRSRARSTRRVEASREYGRVGLELSLGTQASDRMVGEPTTFTKGWFDAWPDAVDATPLLAAARAIKTDQEIERMRLANEICAAAMEHVRAELRPGMKESEAAALWQGFVHGEGTGWRGRSSSRSASRSSGRARASGPSPRPATGPSSSDEPTLFEIWVCADGYWCDHTKLLCPGELRADYRELEAELLEVYGRAIDHCRPGASLAELDRLIRDGLDAMPAIPASRRTRSATASARAPTSRRTRTRPAAARSRRGWCSRSSRAATGRAAAACASRTTS